VKIIVDGESGVSEQAHRETSPDIDPGVNRYRNRHAALVVAEREVAA
jgi:hypothetical protein